MARAAPGYGGALRCARAARNAQPHVARNVLVKQAIPRQARQVWRQAFGAWRQTYGAWRQASRVWCQAWLGATVNRSLAPDFESLAPGFQSLAPGSTSGGQALGSEPGGWYFS